MSEVMCISHIGDVDGCVCASLVHKALEADYLLASYGNINDCLNRIKKSYDLVIICDIGLSEANLDGLIKIRKFAKIIIIDHHPIEAALLHKCREISVELVHDLSDCASFLTLQKFKNLLPHEAELLASYAAVSDRRESGSIAKEIVPKYDRDFLLFETMILTHALENKSRADPSFKRRLVKHISRFEYPHRINNLFEMALENIERIAVLRKELRFKATILGRVAYVESGEDSNSMLANLLLDVCNADVGISYNTDLDKDTVDLSIRVKWNVDIDIGLITKQLSQSLGGFGGGHPKASGARISENKLNEFIHAIYKYLN